MGIIKGIEAIKDHNEIKRLAKDILKHLKVADYENARLAAQSVVNAINNLEKRNN